MSEIEPGLVADADQAARAAAAGGRGASEPTPVAELLSALAEAKASWERRRLSVLESDCPTCRVDSATALVCPFRGQEFCAHAGYLRRRAHTRVLEVNMRAGKVPPSYWAMIAAGKHRDTAAVAAARRIVAEEGRLAIFAGGVGGGKTLGACLALAERGGFFCGSAELDPFGREVNELLEHCGDVPLLVLDDAGAGRSISDVARARLEQLVCARWDAGRATIVTTNLTQAAFWPLYGGHLGRIADRLSSDPVGWVRCLEDTHRNPVPFNERAEGGK